MNLRQQSISYLSTIIVTLSSFRDVFQRRGWSTTYVGRRRWRWRREREKGKGKKRKPDCWLIDRVGLPPWTGAAEFVAYFTGDRCKCVFIEPVSLYVRAYHRTTAVFRLMKLLEIAETMLGYRLVTCPNSTHFFRYARYIIDLSFRPCQPPFITPIIYWILRFIGKEGIWSHFR